MYKITEKYLNYLENYLDNFIIKKSPIHGVGVFSKQYFNKDEFINTAIIQTGEKTGNIDLDYKTTEFGAHLNHSKMPNAETRIIDGVYKTFAIKDIYQGDEITVDYTVNQELEQPEKGWK